MVRLSYRRNKTGYSSVFAFCQELFDIFLSEARGSSFGKKESSGPSGARWRDEPGGAVVDQPERTGSSEESVELQGLDFGTLSWPSSAV
jgi:hypothetical protein